MDLTNFRDNLFKGRKIYTFLLKMSINLLSFVGQNTHNENHLQHSSYSHQPNINKLSYNKLSRGNNITS